MYYINKMQYVEEDASIGAHGINSSVISFYRFPMCIGVCEFYLNSDRHKKTEKEEGGKELNEKRKKILQSNVAAAAAADQEASTQASELLLENV